MKVAFHGGAHQLVAVLGGDLDEIAQHIVVPDFQRLDLGVLGVARLQRGNDAARFVAQRPRLVERLVIMRGDEAAVAAQQRQLVGERRGKFGGNRGIGPPQRRRSRRQTRADPRQQQRGGRQLPALRDRPSRTAARSRGPPRPTTSRAERAGEIGRRRKTCAQLGAQIRLR